MSSLRILGSVGEPINPEAYIWYRKTIGGDRTPVVDTWWQTETGAIMISPLPGVTAGKPGSAMTADPRHRPPTWSTRTATRCPTAPAATSSSPRPGPRCCAPCGATTTATSTPTGRGSRHQVGGMGYYFAGDGAKKDDDGDIWVLGRVDDVMNVSGHRLSTTEIESALVSHPKVAEAAVVGAKDEDTGQAVCAFVILREDAPATAATLRHRPGARASTSARRSARSPRPRQIMIVAELPKTRSGKIMRRLLRDVAENREVGDVTTLADSSVMDLISNRLTSGSGAEID